MGRKGGCRGRSSGCSWGPSHPRLLPPARSSVLVGRFPLASLTHLAPRPVPSREPRGLGKRQPAQRPGRGRAPRSLQLAAGSQRGRPACVRASPWQRRAGRPRPSSAGPRGGGRGHAPSILGLRAESPGAAGVRSRSGPLSRTGNPGAATTRGFRARKEQRRPKSPVCDPCSKSMPGRGAPGGQRSLSEVSTTPLPSRHPLFTDPKTEKVSGGPSPVRRGRPGGGWGPVSCLEGRGALP